VNHRKELEKIVDHWVGRLMIYFDGSPGWEDDIRKKLAAMAEDVSKVVRDSTIRFYESKKKHEVVPEDLRDLPLFKDVHRPPRPPDAPPEVR